MEETAEPTVSGWRDLGARICFRRRCGGRSKTGFRRRRQICLEAAAVMDTEVVSAFRKPGICPGNTVAVFGAGPAGLIAIQCARVRGAGVVILSGTRPERLALGKRLGADFVFDVCRTDIEAELKALTNGRGVDLAFDAAG